MGDEMKEYILYEDPGHAWLRVKKSELKELNIDNLISEYSYQDDKFVYLEEDDDILIFLNAKISGSPRDWWEKNTTRKYEEDSSIRKLKSYEYRG